MNTPTSELPAVVIGAGPIGLAAAHLIDRGITPVVMEAGPAAGSAVREWSHVRLFSPWGQVTDPAAEKLLAPTGPVRSVVSTIAGDTEAADRVERTMPGTGLRGGAGLFDTPDATRAGQGEECRGAPAALRIGVAALAVSGGC